MEQQVQNPTPDISTAVTPVPVQPNHTVFVPILLVILSLLLFSTGFLVYQNMQLKKQLTIETTTSPPVPIPSNTPGQSDDLKTFTSSDLGITFQYASDWSVVRSPVSVINAARNRIITLSHYDQNTRSVMGITYCGAHPEDATKCATIVVENRTFTIEWNDASYNSTTPSGNGLLGITMTAYPQNQPNLPSLNAGDRSFFLSFLRSVHFLNVSPSPASSYTCPANGWVGCMPILSEEGKKACSAEAMAWYKANCPDFKGAAL